MLENKMHPSDQLTAYGEEARGVLLYSDFQQGTEYKRDDLIDALILLTASNNILADTVERAIDRLTSSILEWEQYLFDAIRNRNGDSEP